MKFLAKSADSTILTEGLTYRQNNASNNTLLRERLVNEQRNFCAYSEKYLSELDSVEVEHFTSDLKYKDDYYNYYAVIRHFNLKKKDEHYKSASFHDNRFFQNKEELDQRIAYVKGEFVYEEIDPADKEAKDFIDFLQLNSPEVTNERKRHAERLIEIFFTINKWGAEEVLAHFRKYKQELHFITALEVELNIDLSEFYN